ncbi:MAG: hypothetical protein NC043_04220 [Muribaculaceae bacterium]|nr:hypothetical protein [Muribaculaceae bacterium]
MNTSVFQSRLTSIQSNLLSLAYILTSSRDTAYSLLNATTSSMLKNESRYVDSADIKAKAFEVMRSIFASRYSASLHRDILADRRAQAYRLRVEHADETLPAGMMSLSSLQGALNGIDELYRTPYTMYITGHTAQEICTALHLPIATVSARIKYTAKKVMRYCSALS